ncbi:hypothetical protein A2714_02185 [Candidatus Woesebacteria bacterium RIFCSPHIGHO2_01_FULL_38_9]|uniref:Probable membrane transporter protein n=2 Tax=Candidatus Woeseibacteriota TaxID=1752722 RepID=A0A1F7Y2W7_9BACT|nr:MAG: hypothetical protein A2714_02185 [Candidatus Woesebacteria bacterium RIFCSPHIGHO2_01_FULL_38_9]OGM60371.1 MAG: hypothetical protein A3A75_03945 [Candidatus Woesebacteria bacterium RIFCSPLOWO2_01_FULL_39_10]
MELILIGLLTLVASFVGTLAGFGSSTIVLPILVIFLPFEVALLFVGIIHFFDDLWEIILFRQAVNWKLLLSFGIPGVIASTLGALLAVYEPNIILLRSFGLLLIFYVFLIIKKPSFKIPNDAAHAGIGGLLSGFIAGIFGIGGPVRAMFLSAFNLPKETYLFTSGAIAIFIDPARLITYFAGGTRLPGNLFWGLFLFVPITFIGSRTAKNFVDKIPQKKFRNVIAVFLFIAGLKLLLFP